MAQNKAEFVRSLPPTMPAKEVIAKAEEKGIKLSRAYVYVVRSNGPHRKPQAVSRRHAKAGNGAGDAMEMQFVSLALDLGFARAQAILDQVRARAQQLL